RHTSSRTTSTGADHQRVASSFSCPSWAKASDRLRTMPVTQHSAVIPVLWNSRGGHKPNRNIERPLRTRAKPRGGRGRRRLGYAGGTRRSVQSLGLNALEAEMRVFVCPHNLK